VAANNAAGQTFTRMNANASMRKNQIVVAVATAHLFLWFLVLSWLGEKAFLDSPRVIAAMIALMVAAWIQYRAVLSLRRRKKEPSAALS
jgi:hypothetical protein